MAPKEFETRLEDKFKRFDFDIWQRKNLSPKRCNYFEAREIVALSIYFRCLFLWSKGSWILTG